MSLINEPQEVTFCFNEPPSLTEITEYSKQINDEYIKTKHQLYFTSSSVFWGDRITTLIVRDDHFNHNEISGYKENILEFLSQSANTFKFTNALDYGCGGGRNLRNLLNLVDFKCVHGIDISKYNVSGSIENAREKGFDVSKIKTSITDGWNIGDESLLCDQYHFIMSVITFEHIPLYDVRLNIMKHMYRKLAVGGTMLIQFATDERYPYIEYYANTNRVAYEVLPVNSSVQNTNQLLLDFMSLGFDKNNISISESEGDLGSQWFFVRAIK